VQAASEIEMRHLPAIWIYGYVGGRQGYVRVRVGVANFFLGWAWQTFFWVSR